jgi:predicted nucleic acid-binding protein
MIVLDTSAALDGYFQPSSWNSLMSLIKSQTILVPQHFEIECMSGLRRIDRYRSLSAAEFSAFKLFIQDIPLIVVPTITLYESIWDMRYNTTSYDANYVSIAMATNSLLITHDQKLAKAASGLIDIQRLDASAP